LAADPKPEADRVLFDFEDEADLKAWSNRELRDAKEPAAKLERSTDNATSGKHSLKITFAGGKWPTVGTERVPDDWQAYETFRADVAVSRPCLIGFCVMQEGSQRGGGWDAGVSRWTKTALLLPGKHTISAPLHPNGGSAIRPKLENGRVLGKVVGLEIFAYSPADGETLYVDNIRLLKAKETPAAAAKVAFKVLGTDLEVADVQELGKKLKDGWKKPERQTVAEAEAAFRARYDELKKKHPGAVLAVLRDGAKGFDPDAPDRAFAGWKDTHINSHGPDALTVDRAVNYGKNATLEVFMRHRSVLMRVDLSSLPKGAEVLEARLLLVRARPINKEHDPEAKPTMWVAEPCNRPWEESEVNAYEYARGKFWREVGGRSYGDDPDFAPLFLVHGPGSAGPACSWDFTEAVRWWTDGKHANHGFMLHGDSFDYLTCWTREAPEVKDRPALLVIYRPK
jgi:hypothetical protein